MCVCVCDALAQHLLSFRRDLPASEPTVALEVEREIKFKKKFAAAVSNDVDDDDGKCHFEAVFVFRAKNLTNAKIISKIFNEKLITNLLI